MQDTENKNYPDKNQAFFAVPHNIFNNLKSHHTYFKLLIFLLAKWNTKKQPEWFNLTNQDITNAIGLSGSTISLARKFLKEFKYINFNVGKYKQSPSSYHIEPTFLKPFNLKPFKSYFLSPLKKEQSFNNRDITNETLTDQERKEMHLGFQKTIKQL